MEHRPDDKVERHHDDGLLPRLHPVSLPRREHDVPTADRGVRHRWQPGEQQRHIVLLELPTVDLSGLDRPGPSQQSDLGQHNRHRVGR